ncbi:MAG TPA: hypothetical protein VMU56_06040 [Beijerinckiaceae bacterium]|nr:hypothetical protein [Beijerinckiaceae bacterium]
MIEDLLNLAEELSRREQGRPKQVSLRRSVATAYYAIFHALTKLCADQLVGATKPWLAYTPIYRMLDHGAARRVFERVRRDSDAELARIGLFFVTLHEARTIADYSPEPFPLSRQDVCDIVQESRDIVRTIDLLPSSTKLLLAVQLIAKTR